MTIKHLSEKLRRALHSFSSADSGNVLITFTLALLPIMGAAGAAVDYSRANSDKTAMQAAIDATALWRNNGTCSSSYYSTKSSCTGAGKTWTHANHNTWNGCITDRGDSTGPNAGNYDTNVVAPTTSVKATLFPAEQYSPCPQALMALSYNWSGMTTLVNNMSPGGNTNQAIGLALGWMSLVGGGPFPTPPAMDPNYKYQQVIILLTDGLNT
jgi:Flp pilus assembly protein TadG